MAPCTAHYVSSKAVVIGLTTSPALELGPEGITVNTIPPGVIDTPMPRRAEERVLLVDSVEHHAGQTPLRRIGRPDHLTGDNPMSIAVLSACQQRRSLLSDSVE